MPRNKLTDMHNILMEQLERLNDDDLTDEELQAEIKRSRAMADISAQIVDNARVHIEAAQFQADYNRGTPVLPKMLGIEVKKWAWDIRRKCEITFLKLLLVGWIPK